MVLICFDIRKVANSAVLPCLQTFGEGIHKVKVYHHYAYKMEAAPPFRVCSVSEEIKLVTRKPEKSKPNSWTHQRIWKDTSQTAYISGLYMDNDKVLMSYGSSDIDARLLAITMKDVEALFTKGYECGSAQVMDPGSGEELPLASGAAAAGGKVVRTEYKHHHLKHRRAHHRDQN